MRASKNRKGKREYLNDEKSDELVRELQIHFEKKIEVPLIRHVKRQRGETLINEEALLLAKYFRNEIDNWIPRIIDR